jgi:hypothetical protein
VSAGHVHAKDARCLPTCPAWSEGALEYYALRRRHDEMLEACRTAESIEFIIVAPGVAGVSLPQHLEDQDLVKLTLVVGRDTPEVLLDDWGIRCNLTFSGRRHDCAFPWPSVRGGVLRPPPRKRPRFGVIEGGKKD